ncbi:MAG: LamG-like jellyroll fold domain-containing protein [Bacteroidota bacterium]
MKSLQFSLSLLAIFLFCSGSAFSQQEVLHLRLDKEANDQTVSDQSGKDNHAALIGGLEFVPDRFGNDCRALKFDGATGYLTIPHHKTFDFSREFTYAAWVKIPDKPGLQWLTLICKGQLAKETPTSPAFRAQFTSVTSSINTSSTKTIGNIRQSFPTNRWFHVAAVFDGFELTVYQDGEVAARYSLYDPLYPNTEPINIGRDIPGNTEFFEGTMDDVHVFNKALNKKKIQALYNDNSDNGLGSACPQVFSSTQPSTPVTPPTPQPSPTRSSPDVPNWEKLAEKPETPSQPPISPETNQPLPQPQVQPPVVVQELPDRVLPSPSAEDTIPEGEDFSYRGAAKNNLTLVLDVSGSMNSSQRLPLLKKTFLELIPYMRQEDRISIILFAQNSKIVLDGVPATDQNRISRTIERLGSGGKTNGKPALKKALRLARANFIEGGNNRIIMATDGSFRLETLYGVAGQIKKKDIHLTMFSFGDPMGGRKRKFDKIAENGGGTHEVIKEENVREALLRETQAVLK